MKGFRNSVIFLRSHGPLSDSDGLAFIYQPGQMFEKAEKAISWLIS